MQIAEITKYTHPISHKHTYTHEHKCRSCSKKKQRGEVHRNKHNSARANHHDKKEIHVIFFALFVGQTRLLLHFFHNESHRCISRIVIIVELRVNRTSV